MMLSSEYRDRRIILSRTKIQNDQILLFDSTPYSLQKSPCPKHFVALDDETRSIIVAIRGTASIQDAVLDLYCEPKWDSFLGEYAHSGILASAYATLRSVNATLHTAISRYPYYRLVLTGHSLGAGVSLLISMLLQARRRAEREPVNTDKQNGCNQINPNVVPLLPDSVRIYTYAFAPPPVISSTSTGTGNNLMNTTYSFVHCDDIVPRLSLHSVKWLLGRVRLIDGLNATLMQRFNAIADPMGKGRALREKVEEIMEQRLPSSRNRAASLLPHVQVPGKVFLLPRRKLVTSQRIFLPLKRARMLSHRNRPGARWAKPSDLDKLLILPQAIADHMPKQYENVLNEMLA